MNVFSTEPYFKKAHQLIEFDRLKLGCSEIDIALKGGFKSCVLNEIFGIAGSGKTQICLVLSLMVQLPRELGGLDKVAVYICTEDVFPVNRLHELSNFFEKKYGQKDFLDKVYITHISDCDKLMLAINIHLPYLAKVKDIGLIVIDSIGGLFRSDNLDVAYDNRSRKFQQIAIALRKIGLKYNCVIICTNQVTDDLEQGNTDSCLGLAWSNLVNSRFLITRVHSHSQRIFQVIFATDLPNFSCSFYIIN